MAEQEQKFDASWNVTTSKMLIQFYKENTILWDKNHKDYGKKHLQKKVLMCNWCTTRVRGHARVCVSLTFGTCRRKWRETLLRGTRQRTGVSLRH